MLESYYFDVDYCLTGKNRFLFGIYFINTIFKIKDKNSINKTESILWIHAMLNSLKKREN